jgi:hypothetical protein
MLRWSISLFLIAMLFTACGDDETGTEGFRIFVPGEVIIIPSAGKDCYNDDLAEAYFKIVSFSLEWDRTDQDLVIAFARVDIKSSSLPDEFRGVMDGEEFSAYTGVLTGGDTITPLENGRVPAAQGGTRIVRPRVGCSLPLGGLNIGENPRNFTVKAELMVQGVAIGVGADNLGVEEPVRARVNFNLVYNLN